VKINEFFLKEKNDDNKKEPLLYKIYKNNKEKKI
jgi:hypothetical protein